MVVSEFNDDCISDCSNADTNNDDIRDRDFNIEEYEAGSSETDFESDDVTNCLSDKEENELEINAEIIKTTNSNVTLLLSEKIK